MKTKGVLFKRETFNQILFYWDCDLHLLFEVFYLDMVIVNVLTCASDRRRGRLPS